MGQIQGAFVQGLGLYCMEECLYNEEAQLLNPNPWHYTLPASHSIPIKWNVSFLEKTPLKGGVYGSKATGEPPLLLAMSVNFATQHAILAARKDQEVPKDRNTFMQRSTHCREDTTSVQGQERIALIGSIDARLLGTMTMYK
eukprot:TRINITY_DN8294_c0_g1_i1.p1 TRINITY_DN8294_c0_g1~~TRINITY_DN8294_c0_g1_i1.p1  ORF type:complete len:161 (-),score=19.21 TRINITY_DN8294_c0_g1_i1:64-489(-)